nr:lipoyl(octanoyl) transferase LipB [Motilibacter aurantiacus]
MAPSPPETPITRNPRTTTIAGTSQRTAPGRFSGGRRAAGTVVWGGSGEAGIDSSSSGRRDAPSVGKDSGPAHQGNPQSTGGPGAVCRRTYSADVSDPLRLIREGHVAFAEAWARQRELHAARVADEAPDTVLLVEHDSVYTAGRRTAWYDRPTDGTEVVEVDRGGRITWHGPGQLVGYPILRLPDPVDVVAHVRRVEEVVIRACADLGLATDRVDGRSGVWVLGGDGAQDRKVAAIGCRVARGVTMHGFALNCDSDLSAFERIVPCGITDAGVTSLTRELGRRVSIEEALPVVERHLVDVMGQSVPGRRLATTG